MKYIKATTAVAKTNTVGDGDYIISSDPTFIANLGIT